MTVCRTGWWVFSKIKAQVLFLRRRAECTLTRKKVLQRRDSGKTACRALDVVRNAG